MDIRKIKKLIDLLERSNLAEIEITEGEEAVRITRNTSTSATSPANVIVPKSPVESAPLTPIDKTNNTISSPMVGTFYLASSPTSMPFVEVGQTIKVGQVICIIEAMKIMNKIEADKSGVISEILVADGDAVEFGQDLILLR